MPDAITFFHAPNTRSTGVAILLEELGAQYQTHIVNMTAGEQRQPAYLAINPMGKVPAIRHGDALVTEQAAIFIYLADLFPAAGLAPAINDPLRGPYLRWLTYYGSCLEPAVIDHFLKREPGPPRMMPYGDYDTVLRTVTDQLRPGPYLLGDTFTAADILWGTALKWMTGFKVVPELPEIVAYVERVCARPEFARVSARDAELAAEHAKAAAAD
ncbi:MAG: glutathione S-transferase family protein [Acetobacteraceae bacterium]|jgi:glutathione S-transferase